jgi:acyl carrier protein
VLTRAGVSSGCRLAPGSVLGPGSLLLPDVWLGERARVGIGCIIQSGARVGADAVIGHQVTLESDVVVGYGAMVLSGARVRKGTHVPAGGCFPERVLVSEVSGGEVAPEESSSCSGEGRDPADLIQLLQQWVAEITDSTLPPFTSETDLVGDAGLDSLALAELAARVRQRFHISLRAMELGSDLRVGRLARLIAERATER